MLFGEPGRKERESIRILVQMNADGIILMTNNEEVEQDVKASAIPVVCLKNGSCPEAAALPVFRLIRVSRENWRRNI